MEKLELKHLAPYLPYGLKLQFIFKKEKIFLLSTYDEYKNGEQTILIAQALNGYYKPILRPLSDLTKEIEVNGEKFVPIDIIYKLWYGNYLGQFSKEIILQKIKLFSTKMPYFIVEKLHEWHFDTNQLIEKGLAIDFNTL